MRTFVRYDADGVILETVQIAGLPGGRKHPFAALGENESVLEVDADPQGGFQALRDIHRGRVDMGTHKHVAAEGKKGKGKGKKKEETAAGGTPAGPALAGGGRRVSDAVRGRARPARGQPELPPGVPLPPGLESIRGALPGGVRTPSARAAAPAGVKSLKRESASAPAKAPARVTAGKSKALAAGEKQAKASRPAAAKKPAEKRAAEKKPAKPAKAPAKAAAKPSANDTAREKKAAKPSKPAAGARGAAKTTSKTEKSR
jgi:hypothetical protein